MMWLKKGGADATDAARPPAARGVSDGEHE
jgi:hypothetical protein